MQQSPRARATAAALGAALVAAVLAAPARVPHEGPANLSEPATRAAIEEPAAPPVTAPDGGEGDTSPADATPSTPDPGIAAQIEASGSADVVVVTDDDASVESTLGDAAEQLGDGVYRADIGARELATLAGLPGIVVSPNRPVVTTDIDEDGMGTAVDLAGNARTAATVSPLESDFTWGFATTSTVTATDPDLPLARAATGVDGTGQVIAIIDTGIDSTAAGLTDAGKVVTRVDFSPATAACTDGGLLDPQGHGTHVASIAAGAPNAADPSLVGVAPAARLVDLRVFACDGSATTSNIDAALAWLLSNHATYGITVANLSLGSPGSQQDGKDSTSVLVNRLVAAGVSVAIAAGNEGDAPTTIYSPGTARWATTVGSVGQGPSGAFLSYFSSRGPIAGRDGIDLLAPGSSITAAKSTSYGGTETSLTLSGTSMASPYVAGLLALVRDAHPTLAPSGTTCTLSVTCPEGVVNATMSDPVLDAVAVTDWFDAGSDPISGRGLVDAAATVRGTQAPAASTFTGTFDGAGPVIVEIPARDVPVAVTVVTDAGVPASASGAEWFDAAFVTSQSTTLAPSRPCSLQGVGTQLWCGIAASAEDAFIYAFTAPASAETTWFRMNSSTPVGYHVTVSGAGSDASSSAGVVADAVALDAAGDGTVVIRRTAASASASELTLSASPTLTVAASVTLPAGPAGTSASVPVTLAPGASFSSPHNGGYVRVEQGASLRALVPVTLAESAGVSGVITVAGAAATDGDVFETFAPQLAADGTVFATSTQPSIARGSSGGVTFTGLMVADATSSQAVPVNLPQTTASSLTALGISSDARRLLVHEAPAGAGLVTGDSDARAVVAVWDRDASQAYEIGDPSRVPDVSDRATWPVLANDGTMAAYVSGSTLYVESGAGFATSTAAGTLGTDTLLSLVGVSGSGLVAEIRTSGGSTLLVKYPVAGGARVTLASSVIPGAARLSPSGGAVGFERYDGRPACVSISTLVQRSFSTGGRYVTGAVAPADNCLTAVTTIERLATGGLGSSGEMLVTVSGTSTVTAIATAYEPFRTSWIYDATGARVVTVTGVGWSAADTNGLVDLYRGAMGAGTMSLSAAPAIVGEATTGQTLTVNPGTWTPTAQFFAYQWLRGSQPIAGAVSRTYVPTAEDVGSTLSVMVTATTSTPGYQPATALSAPTSAVTDPYLATVGGISVGYGPTSGGTLVTITGTGLDVITSVTFDGVPGTAFKVTSDGQISVRTPAGSSLRAPIVVTDGVHTTDAGFFAFTDTTVVTQVAENAVSASDLLADQPYCYGVAGAHGVPVGATGVLVQFTASTASGPGTVAFYADAGAGSSTPPADAHTTRVDVGIDGVGQAFVDLSEDGRLCAYAEGTGLGALTLDVGTYVLNHTGISRDSSWSVVAS